MNWPEMFAAIEKGDLKALYLIGVDPFELGLPKEKVQAALGRLEFLVVQDCVKTEAADYAKVVLPAASFVEKSGTATNCERRVQGLVNTLPSPGDAQADFCLINGLLEYLQPELKASDLASAFAEATQLMTDLGGVTYESLPIEGIQWPVVDEQGTERLTVSDDGKAKFRFFSARF
ncbi:MAG: molybdopterin-dependent oxidoreductase [Syntrophobacteraceae bacterium]|nr:molybdopterin-dependent oxidoreductase [Syntrophobacteraceae bacterium]